jgi:hypothetical protein
VDGGTGCARAVIEARTAGPGGRVPTANGHAARGSCHGRPGRGGGARPGTNAGGRWAGPAGAAWARLRARVKRAGPRRVERERGKGGPAGLAGGPKGVATA